MPHADTNRKTPEAPIPYTIEPLGTIRTPYTTKVDCPIQGVVIPDGRGTVEVLPEYEEALRTIDTFSHLYLFYLFDRAGEIKLSRPTFLDNAPHGVFASRHPCRPNGIGMSVVKLEKHDGCLLEVSGVDMLDGSPLIDIKPHVPRFDYRKDANNGWVERKMMGKKPEGRE